MSIFPTEIRYSRQRLARCVRGVLWILMILLSGCHGVSGTISSDATALRWLNSFNPADSLDRFVVDVEQLRPPESAAMVHAGDLLELTVWDLYEPGIPHTSPLRIDDQGHAAPPLLDELSLSGLSLGEVEQLLIDKYRTGEILLQPRVLLRRLETPSCEIQIVGGVERPGDVKLPLDQATVYRAIQASGGLKPNSSQHWTLTRYASQSEAEEASQAGEENPDNEIKMASGSEETEAPQNGAIESSTTRGGIPAEERTFDLSKPQELQELKRIMLKEGDVLKIPERDPTLRISGIVKKPGNYPMEFGQTLTLREAIELSGGLLLPTLPSQIVVTRPIPGSQNVERWSVPILKGEVPEGAPSLRTGDSVHIEVSPHAQVKRVIGELRHLRKPAESQEDSPRHGVHP